MNEQEEAKTPEKKSKKGLISNVIFLILLTALVVTLFLSFGEIQKIGETLAQITTGNNWLWLLAAFGAVIVYFLLWPITLNLFAKAAGSTTSKTDAYLIGCSEHFYNGVTPFATGGQPFQIYSFTKRGTSASVATSAVLANFVTFMIATNLIAFVSLFFYPEITKGLAALNMEWAKYVAIVGYTINFLVLLFMIALGTSKHLKNWIIAIIKFLTKPKFLNKHFAKLIPSFEAYCENAQIGFRSIWVHKKTFIFSLLIKIVTMLVYYLIPYFLIKAVGLNASLYDAEGMNALIVLFATSFAITAVVWVPTPGGTGGIEYAFSIVISSVCLMASANSGAALALSLLWRLVTYYFTLIVSFVFVCIFQARDKKALSMTEETPNV